MTADRRVTQRRRRPLVFAGRGPLPLLRRGRDRRASVDDTAANLRARVRELQADLEAARRIIADGHAAAVRDVTAEVTRLRAWHRHITLASRGMGAALARQALYGAPAPSTTTTKGRSR